MAKPNYQGPGQPLADAGGGLLGRFGTFFGGGTPAYSGNGQPSSNANYLGATPTYAAAPLLPPMTCESNVAISQNECPIDPNALAAGQIAIVIPRLAPIEK